MTLAIFLLPVPVTRADSAPIRVHATVRSHATAAVEDEVACTACFGCGDFADSVAGVVVDGNFLPLPNSSCMNFDATPMYAER